MHSLDVLVKFNVDIRMEKKCDFTMTLNVAWLLVPDGLVSVFLKLLHNHL